MQYLPNNLGADKDQRDGRLFSRWPGPGQFAAADRGEGEEGEGAWALARALSLPRGKVYCQGSRAFFRFFASFAFCSLYY